MQRGLRASEERPVCKRLASDPLNISWNLAAIFLRWGGRWDHSAESTGGGAAAAAGAALVERAALVFFFEGVLFDVEGLGEDDDDDDAALFSCFACRFHFLTSAFAVDATSWWLLDLNFETTAPTSVSVKILMFTDTSSSRFSRSKHLSESFSLLLSLASSFARDFFSSITVWTVCDAIFLNNNTLLCWGILRSYTHPN